MVAEVRPHEVLTKLVGVGSPAQGPFFCIVCSFLHFSRLFLQHWEITDYLLSTFLLILPIAAAQLPSIIPFFNNIYICFASQGYF